jgi:hypothetical protein
MLIICAVVGCGRSPAGAPSGRDAAPPSARNAPRDATAASVQPPEPAPEPRQATRATLDAPAARALLAGADPSVVARHFAGSRALEIQSIELGRGRRAVLVYRSTGEPRPLLLVRDRDARLAWSRNRPTGGMLRPVTELALASGLDGGVVLFSYDVPTEFVAARMWDADGSLLADYEALRVASCKALSALYWPRRGWLVGCSTRNEARLSLLTEAGALAWNGLSGVELATDWRAPAPISLVSDTDDSVMAWHMNYLAAHPTPRSADHVFVERYDARGRPLWPGPLDAGRLPVRVSNNEAHIEVTRVTPGTVRAAVARPSRFTVIVSSEGRVLKP